jgi:hypothetical protein
LIDTLSDPSQPLLALPMTAMVGTFSPGAGFFRVDDLPLDELMPGASARFFMPAGSASIARRPAAFASAPCAIDPPLPPEAVTSSETPIAAFTVVPLLADEMGDGTSDLTIDDATLTARLHVDQVTDDDGRTWLCPAAP